MKKINKIINIASIFMLMGMMVESGAAYAFPDPNLRPMHGFNKYTIEEMTKRFKDLYYELSKSESHLTIIQNLKLTHKIISGQKKDAVDFMKSFEGSQFLVLLNRILYNAKGMDEYEDIKKEVNAILDRIFSVPFLSNIITEKLDLFKATADEGVIIEFFDGNIGQSAGFMRENFPEVLNILKDPKKTQDLILLLSLYRLLHYEQPMSIYNGEYEEDTPLEYAIKKNFYISLGDNLYITPISEKFRRHILFRMSSDKQIVNAVEIFIPGDNTIREKHLLSRNRLTFCRDTHEALDDKSSIIKTHLMAEYPKEIISKAEAYGDVIDFFKEPLRIFVYDYSYANQGRRLTRLNKKYIERVRKITHSNNQTSASEAIVKEAMTVAGTFIMENYRFDRDGRGALHIANYRLCLDGKVKFVGDFGGFYKTTALPKYSLKDDKDIIRLKNQLSMVLSRLEVSYPDYNAIFDKVICDVELTVKFIKKFCVLQSL